MKRIILFISFILLHNFAKSQYKDWYKIFLLKDEKVLNTFSKDNKNGTCFILNRDTLDWSHLNIEEYHNIRILDISNCWIKNYQGILTELSKLKKLEYLNIGNIRSGLDTFSIKGLGFKNLKWLSISNCGFRILDESIANMSSLEYLNLGQSTAHFQLSNNLKSLPESFAKLSKLKTLIFSSNALEEIPSSVYKLNNLEVLDISNNEINVLPNELSNLTNLMDLNIGFNKLNSFPSSVIQLSRLKHLNLTETNINQIPKEICNLKDLESIRLGSNTLSELPKLECLSFLKILDLSNCKIEFIPDQHKLPIWIEYLYLSGNETAFFSLKKYRKLKYLVIDKNKISVKDIAIFRTRNVKLILITN
jgi:Leucine-rich repeat (LRR) protein